MVTNAREYSHRWYQEHREEQAAKQRERWANDPDHRERSRARHAAWVKAHPEKVAEYAKTSAARHGPRTLTDEQKASRAAYMRAYVEAHRVRIRRQKYASARGFKVAHTEEEWQAKLALFGHACAYCRATGVRFDRDHIVPLGAMDPAKVDRIENVVPACRSCNARKAGLNVKAGPRSAPVPKRTCPVCGSPMMPSAKRYRTCSQACRKEWNKAHPMPQVHRDAIAAGIRALRRS